MSCVYACRLERGSSQLQTKLAERVEQLEAALGHVKQLQGILPICSYCKKIRNDSNYWQNVESYVADHSQAEFSHGICPTCYETTVKPQLESLRMSPSVESTSAVDRIVSPKPALGPGWARRARVDSQRAKLCFAHSAGSSRTTLSGVPLLSPGFNHRPPQPISRSICLIHTGTPDALTPVGAN